MVIVAKEGHWLTVYMEKMWYVLFINIINVYK